MLGMIKRFMGRQETVQAPALPSGERVYAIGDIHGRIDLFEDLIRAIEADDAQRSTAHTTMILLGDLIDRGPDSAAVVARARDWGRQRHVQFIQGNHEEMLLASRTKAETLRGFLKFGGLETILSYGVDPEQAMAADLDELQALMNAAIPQDDIDFIESFKKLIRHGDYAFVHAGIRPDTPIEHQLGQDCRWIREPFLSHRGSFGAYVVHGHTITEEPEECTNRVGIDTGAFMHGTLTAIGLQGTDRWFIQAHDHEIEADATAA